tara:strand:+ start:1232 stop:1993 length:762 start_codon:yes stop_codon:yes gene_type:complete
MTSRDIRRKFGQNYLKDISILLKMADVISPSSSDNFLEIGPGHGALTEQLNREKISIIGVDIDKNNIEILKNKFTGPANFKFIVDDILNYKIINSRQRIVGNLPYNISTQIILKLIDNCEQIVDVHFLVQKEVAEKIAGKVGTKNWGKLAIKIASFFDNEILFDVPPNAFDIKPKVNSSFIRLIPNNYLRGNSGLKKKLFRLVDLAFSSRRKNIKNNLKEININWQDIGIDPEKRAEQLSLNDFLILSQNLDS